MPERRPHILFVSTDIVGPAMAGPGIRAWELAHTLAAHSAVTLAAPDSATPPESATVRIFPYRFGQAGTLAPALAGADVIVGQGFALAYHPELLASALPIAIDLYDPLIIEGLDLYAGADLAAAEAQHAQYQALTDAQLRRGDFFFCATEAQRDYWLGALTGVGRINPGVARATDRDLRQLIDLVPSGIATSAPARTATPALRGTHPALGPDDVIALWAGGLWDWFDPQILVRAVASLRDECPRLRLVFFGGARPNPHGEPFTTGKRHAAEALAAELGVLNQSVVFIDRWVPYAERGALLAEADLGVSAHLPGIETHFAFRTRLLDYLWARLPALCTAGDSLGELFAAAGCAQLVPPHDLAGWLAAFRQLYHGAAARGEMRAAAGTLAEEWTWEQVAQPLIGFCTNPRRLPAITPAADTRVAELQAALDERGQYVAHVEQEYQRAVAGLQQHERGIIARLRRRLHL